ncbi:MAG: ABC transporter permease subunit, partial [Jatrophihabitantaceae bacterium]
MTSQQDTTALQAPAENGPTDVDEFGAASRSQGRQALHRFTHSVTSMSAFVFFVLIVVVSFIGPYFYKWKYDIPDVRLNAQQNNLAQNLSPGQLGHPLGTDENGYDLLSRMMRGTQRDVIIVVISTAIAVFLGILIGSIAGYFSSLVDNLLMRFVDVMLCVPILVILIIVASRYPSLGSVGLAVLLGLFGWMGLSRLVR